MITKRDIEEAIFLIKEKKKVEIRLQNCRNNVIKDSVTASSKEFPYIKFTAKIEGMPSPKINKLEEALRRLEKKISNKITYITQYLDRIESSEVRQIIDYIINDGLDYNQIAHKMNTEYPLKEYTADNCRMKVNRCLKKIKKI